jgi:2-polyprenyl-6-hydroxyphenyl methylase/3-demethylubiquinone-9 3-methyltransferase
MAMNEPSNLQSSIEPDEVARFAALADEWWDPAGKFAPLHQLNPARLGFIREVSLARFDRDGAARAPFAGLSLLDVGCGGGLVAEPMTRLGFDVTAIDAAAEGLAVARVHAQDLGLAIDYRAETVESLLAGGRPAFDVVLALEVIEHVAAPSAFVADCARLLAPGGVLILSTLNRTLRSLALGKIAAEYLLRWAPAGTHDWRKFVTPAELRAMLEACGLEGASPAGLAFDPLSGQWRRSADSSVNYMMTATHAAAVLSPPSGGRTAEGREGAEAQRSAPYEPLHPSPQGKERVSVSINGQTVAGLDGLMSYRPS